MSLFMTLLMTPALISLLWGFNVAMLDLKIGEKDVEHMSRAECWIHQDRVYGSGPELPSARGLTKELVKELDNGNVGTGRFNFQQREELSAAVLTETLSRYPDPNASLLQLARTELEKRLGNQWLKSMGVA